MPLHPILVEKLNLALEAAPPLPLTPRDARLLAVPGAAHAVIGLRRAGKTTFLHQLLAQHREALPPERALYRRARGTGWFATLFTPCSGT